MTPSDSTRVDGRTLKQPSVWTEERVERLKVLWAEGYSATEIAADMGLVSRCAALGKVHRLNLEPRVERENPSGRKPCKNPAIIEARRLHHNHAQRVRRAAERGLPEPAMESNPLTPTEPTYEKSLNLPFGDLRQFSRTFKNQCRFIEGDAPDYLCCGNDTLPGDSYCRHHFAITCNPQVRQKFKVIGSRRGMKASNFSGSYEAA